MKRKDVLRRLEERLARGEISEKTYQEIKTRYDSEPEEPEVEPETPPDASLADAVSRLRDSAMRAAEDTTRAVEEAMRAVDFSGIGVKLSEEAIRIAGSGVVTGQPVRTREFKAAGSARVRGDLETEVAKVAGSCAFEGNVQAEEFRSSGSSRIAGSLKAEQVESSGSLRIDKDLDAEEVLASGSLQVGGTVHAEEFHSSGAVHVGGELVAEEVHLELGGSSSIPAIRAKEVHVRSTGGFLRSRGDLKADRIEAKEVWLEGTTAQYVKGDEVTIGPHCRIDVAEAHELVVHESSEVKERRPLSS